MTLPATPETEVTPPARGGDDTAARRDRLEALFTEHGRAVYAFARRRADAADADEVVSETFLVAWRRLDDVPDPARPWLLAVARRCLANVQRGARRQSAVRLRLAGTAAPTAAAPDTDDPAHIASLLDRLSPAERDVVTLLAWDGLTPDEAAVVLGCSRAAVYLRLHRARRRLARELPHRPENGDAR